jgi:hypothetical protein
MTAARIDRASFAVEIGMLSSRSPRAIGALRSRARKAREHRASSSPQAGQPPAAIAREVQRSRAPSRGRETAAQPRRGSGSSSCDHRLKLGAA